MRILPYIQSIGPALLVHDTLILCDLHIGMEASQRARGMLTPSFSTADMMHEIEKYLPVSFHRVVLNGDIKHEFGKIHDEEWRDTLRVLDLLKGKDIIIIKGNHDAILAPIARKRDIQLVDSYRIKDVLILHGDKEPKEIPIGIRTIIIGHEHPAITLREGAKSERYKCFLHTKYKDKDLIVMPSFNPLVAGMDVLEAKTISPLISQKTLMESEVYIIAKTTYHFGKLKRLQTHFG